jgi:hypothetical protein
MFFRLAAEEIASDGVMVDGIVLPQLRQKFT